MREDLAAMPINNLAPFLNVLLYLIEELILVDNQRPEIFIETAVAGFILDDIIYG